MKKVFISVVFLLVGINFVFAGEFSSYEKDVISKLMEFRLSIKNIEKSTDVIAAVEKYHQSMLATDVQNQLGEEAKFVVDNMLIGEKITAMLSDENLTEKSGKDSKAAKAEREKHSEEVKAIVMPQYEKNQAWLAKNPIEQANPYYMISKTDIYNVVLGFIPKTQIMKFGLQMKDDMTLLAEKYPEFSIGQMNMGMFYYFAPGIAGGSKIKGRECFSKAVEVAKNDYEFYNAALSYSQVLFEENKMGESKALLEKVLVLTPNNKTVQQLKELNAAGYSLFDYMADKDKIDAKLKK